MIVAALDAAERKEIAKAISLLRFTVAELIEAGVDCVLPAEEKACVVPDPPPVFLRTPYPSPAILLRIPDPSPAVLLRITPQPILLPSPAPAPPPDIICICTRCLVLTFWASVLRYSASDWRPWLCCYHQY